MNSSKPFNDVLSSTIVNLTKNPTGFKDPENITITYSAVTRNVTLRGDVKAFFKGVSLRDIKDEWVSPAHPDIVGKWFLYYDGFEVLWSQTAWLFSHLQICFAYYGATTKFGTREIHSFLQPDAHDILHHNVGTYRTSGGGLSSYVLNSTTAIDRRPYISAVGIQDEDLLTNVLQDTSRLYTKLSLTGTGLTSFVTDTTDIAYLSGAQPYWNKWNGAAWVQTLMVNNSYQSLWLIAIPTCAGPNCQKHRFVWLQGQSNGTLLQEASLSPNSINLGDLSQILTEFVVINKVIIQYTAGDWKLIQVEDVYGNRGSQVITSSGYLSSVAVDGVTITGNGTPSNPLVSVAGGPGATTYVGTATLDFGAGSNTASVAVIGQTLIAPTSSINVFIKADSTSVDHTANDHRYANLLVAISYGNVVGGTGFTIYGTCIDKIQGSFTVNWTWS